MYRKKKESAKNTNQSQEGIEENSKNLEYKIRSYNIWAHRIVLLLWLLVIAAILIFCFSLVVGWIEYAYRGWTDVWTSEEQAGHAQSGWGFNLGVLPDFLGGMVGILVGFFLEWLIFEKIKNLSKYQTIISCLKIEFDKIEILLTHQRRKINEVITDDIVLSAENSVIIENLPHFFVFRRSRQGERLLSLLQEIHGEIMFRNDALIRQDPVLCQRETSDDIISDYDKKIDELLKGGYTIEQAENTMRDKFFLVKLNDKVYKIGEPYILDENGKPYILDENGCATDANKTMRDSILNKIKDFKRATISNHISNEEA